MYLNRKVSVLLRDVLSEKNRERNAYIIYVNIRWKLSLWPTFLFYVYLCAKVEFEWLRQYWFQGQRYARFCSWWTRPMEQLEKDWKLMETMVRLLGHTASHMTALLSGFPTFTAFGINSLSHRLLTKTLMVQWNLSKFKFVGCLP